MPLTPLKTRRRRHSPALALVIDYGLGLPVVTTGLWGQSRLLLCDLRTSPSSVWSLQSLAQAVTSVSSPLSKRLSDWVTGETAGPVKVAAVPRPAVPVAELTAEPVRSTEQGAITMLVPLSSSDSAEGFEGLGFCL